MEEKSVFEMILNKEIESEIIYEDDDIFSIQDINPVARIHLLIIPKKRINTINNLSDEDTLLVGKMIQAIGYIMLKIWKMSIFGLCLLSLKIMILFLVI